MKPLLILSLTCLGLIACSGEEDTNPAPSVSFSVAGTSYTLSAGISEHEGIPSCSLITNSSGIYTSIIGFALPAPLPATQAFSNTTSLNLCNISLPPNAPGDAAGTGSLTNAEFTYYWTVGEQQWRIRTDKLMSAAILVFEENGGYVAGTFTANNAQTSVRSNNGTGYVHLAENQTLQGNFRMKRVQNNNPYFPD